jgi:hypothetical protein
MKPNHSQEPLESTLFHTILNTIESSLTSFCDVLEELCEQTLNITKTLLYLLYFGGVIYAIIAWPHSPDPLPKMILTFSSVCLLGASLGQWALYKGIPLSGIKAPIITLILIQNLPLEALTNLIKSF